MIMSFPPFFTFAVFRFQREEACSRVCQQCEYFFKVFDSFCYNYQPVLKPRDVLFIFLRKRTGLPSVLTEKGTKSARKRADIGHHFRKGYQLSYENGAIIMHNVKISQGNYIQPVTNILVKS